MGLLGHGADAAQQSPKATAPTSLPPAESRAPGTCCGPYLSFQPFRGGVCAELIFTFLMTHVNY